MGMTPENQPDAIRALYASPSGAYYEQFNFIERMTDVHYEFLMSLPTVVVGKKGFVGVHAGPARFIMRLADLVDPNPKTLEELLWNRPEIAYTGGYTLTHIEKFLEAIHGNILIVGHTPIGYFPKKNVRDGIATFGENQLIFSTGYSGPPGVPAYIEIDLADVYPSVTRVETRREYSPSLRQHWKVKERLADPSPKKDAPDATTDLYHDPSVDSHHYPRCSFCNVGCSKR